jgi:hypothetical protein
MKKKLTAVALAFACVTLASLPVNAADKKAPKQSTKASSAGQECLDSFKSRLKDPESGKVLSFNEQLLVYTATNDYGGRVQGKALCQVVDGKWRRDPQTEISQGIELVRKTAATDLECLNSGKTQCASGPQSLKEAMQALGYN